MAIGVTIPGALSQQALQEVGDPEEQTDSQSQQNEPCDPGPLDRYRENHARKVPDGHGAENAHSLLRGDFPRALARIRPYPRSMIRLVSLLAVTALVLVAWSVGRADPKRLAAFEVGKVLDEPLERLAGATALAWAQPGDKVFLPTPDAPELAFDPLAVMSIERIEGGRWWAPANQEIDPAQAQLINSPRLTGVLIQHVDPDGWDQRVRKGDHLYLGETPHGVVQKATDFGWKLEDGREVSKKDVEAWWPMERTYLEVLQATQLTASVLQPKSGHATKIRLGPLEALAPSEGAESTVDLKEARLSLVRKLRSQLADQKKQLIDQDLTQVDPEGVRFAVRYGWSPTGDKAETGSGLAPLTLETLNAAEGLRLIASRQAPLPSLWSLAPPLIAILLAILLRAPVWALLAGVIGGSWTVVALATGSIGSTLGAGTVAVADTYLRTVLFDRFRFEIIGFVVAMLAMVGIMTRAGGIAGLMERIARLAGNAKRTQLATWLMGLVVFFDDYANTILVGSTMRPLSDRVKIAREKLAYIVDSTAAPVAGLSLFSTWIAFEVSTFQGALPDAGLSVNDGYGIFLQTLPFRFYCLFTLAFVGIVVWTGRDFGPMLRAERRARKGQLLNPGSSPMVGKAATDLEANPNVTPRALVALAPLLTFIGVTLYSILFVGGAFGSKDLGTLQGWADVLYDGSGSAPLLYGSLAGLALAIVLGWMQGLREDMLAAAWSTIRSMGVALAILYLAWMLGEVCSALGTSTYLTVQLGDALPPLVLPVVLFLLAALVAFSTGSSWSTMTILLPLVVGLSFQLGETVPLGGTLLMIMSIGAVLEGAIFGDHCSPISDTTVMSSIASASDHIDHVRTQMPYAMLTMAVALLVGYLPCAYLGASFGGWLPYACLALGLLVLVVVLRTVGRRADEPGLPGQA